MGRKIAKKYEITGIAHPLYPQLHRIRALRDIRKDVCAGDLGGFVESEENLDQKNSCWIFDNALAAENSLVSGDAVLRDNAAARGSATVAGWARLEQNAAAEDFAIVSSGVIDGFAVIAGNSGIYENPLTRQAPAVTDRAVVYGELGGKITVSGNAVILPGRKIDNPTADEIRISHMGITVDRSDRQDLSPSQPGSSQNKKHSEPER